MLKQKLFDLLDKPFRCHPSVVCLIVALGFAISVADIEALAQGGKAKPAPVFDIDATKYNFGDIFVGEEVAHYFRVRNLGNVPLELSESPIYSDRPANATQEMDFQTRLMKERMVLVVNGKPTPS
ncbi:MAG: hypothetical protein AB1757_00925 [Acidobacteriota bacterium]